MLDKREQRFGVGVTAPSAGWREERPAKVKMIVDFAVVNDWLAARLRSHRLCTGWRQIENSQPAVAQRDPGRCVDPRTLAIGASVVKKSAHCRQATFSAFPTSGFGAKKNRKYRTWSAPFTEGRGGLRELFEQGTALFFEETGFVISGCCPVLS